MKVVQFIIDYLFINFCQINALKKIDLLVVHERETRAPSLFAGQQEQAAPKGGRLRRDETKRARQHRLSDAAKLLGEQEAQAVLSYYDISGKGNWSHRPGESILQVRSTLAAVAGEMKLSETKVGELLASARAEFCTCLGT